VIITALETPSSPGPRRPAAEPPCWFARDDVGESRRFYLPAASADSLAFAVVAAGWENCGPRYDVRRHDFPFHVVEFVHSGHGRLELESSGFELVPGTVFTCGPGVFHRISNTGPAGLSKYFVAFTGSGARHLLDRIAPAGARPVHLGRTEEVRSVFEILIRSGCHGPERAERMTALAFELLLEAMQVSLVTEAPAVRRRRAVFQRCQDFVDTHFLQLTGVNQIAAACHIHRSHLCRLFREFTDTTPLHYLQCRRMTWAAEHLLSSSNLVRHVADELGMDPFQFSRTFKRVTGVAPANLIRSSRASGPDRLAS
jgi:AraC-like DNA-binding protein